MATGVKGGKPGGKLDGHRHPALTILRFGQGFWPKPGETADGLWAGHGLMGALERWIVSQDLLVLNCTRDYGEGFPLTVSDQRGKRGTGLKCHTRDCRGFAQGLGPVEPRIVDVAAGYREFFEVQTGHWWASDRQNLDDAITGGAAADDTQDQWGKVGKQWVAVTAPPVASKFRQVGLYCLSDQHRQDLQAALEQEGHTVLHRTIDRHTLGSL